MAYFCSEVFNAKIMNIIEKIRSARLVYKVKKISFKKTFICLQSLYSVVFLVAMVFLPGGCDKGSLQEGAGGASGGNGPTEGSLVPLVVHLEGSGVETRSIVSSSDSVLVAVFNNDARRYLDSFCRFSPSATALYQTTCTPGKKIVVVMSGYVASTLRLEDVLSYDSLLHQVVDLRQDDPLSPVCVGVSQVMVSDYAELRVEMEPVMSRIVLRNLRFDFSGKPYSGLARAENLKVFLVNVNTLSSLMKDAELSPCEWVNQGRLSEDDLGEFSSPDMLFRYSSRSIPVGSQVGVNASLYTYANPVYDYGGKMQFPTMMVIQCELGGLTYYWPIEVNTAEFQGGMEAAGGAGAAGAAGGAAGGAGTGGVGAGAGAAGQPPYQGESQGIERNRTYAFDITIRALGSSREGGAVSPSDIKIENVTREWVEQNEQIVVFSTDVADVSLNFEPRVEADEEFHDLNLFVFNEQGVLEEKRYIEFNPGVIKGNHVDLPVRLYNNCRYSFYCIANAGYSLKIVDEDELLRYKFPLSSPGEQVFGMPYAACARDYLITKSEPVKMEFERLFAKVNLRMDRSELDRDVKLYVKSAKLCNVARRATVFGESSVKEAADLFPQGYYFTGEDAAILNSNYGSKSNPLEFYLLENITGSTLNGQKDYCTYVELKLSYTSPDAYTPDGTFLIYRTYIHDNTGSLDIRRGNAYTVTISPSGDAISRRHSDSWMMDASAIVYK